MEDKNYISKREAAKKGYAKNNEGIFYKKNVLEKYYDSGYLYIRNSKFSDEDRMLAGQMLARDYYLGHLNTMQSVKLVALNIRTTGESDREDVLFYKERYLSAVKAIPYEFWPYVRKVCIEDEELVAEEDIPYKSLKSKNCVYHQKMLLSLGLERLIKFYLQKK